ncbi:MAG TPA: biopolymer transporter ExbD [Vicinamibacterales bacterium]
MPKVHDSGAGHHRGGRGRRVSSSLAEINVVPLVDVMLVLLVIFMVTAPMIQRGIDVNLPVARRAATVEGERLFVTVPTTYHTDGLVYIGRDRVSAGELAGRLKERLQSVADKQVYLQGDGAVQLQDLMKVIDQLKDAGVSQVAIVAKAPGDI